VCWHSAWIASIEKRMVGDVVGVVSPSFPWTLPRNSRTPHGNEPQVDARTVQQIAAFCPDIVI